MIFIASYLVTQKQNKQKMKKKKIEQQNQTTRKALEVGVVGEIYVFVWVFGGRGSKFIKLVRKSRYTHTIALFSKI